MSDPSSPADPSPEPLQPDADRYRDRIDVSDADDDFEYEVEPVDEELLARQKAHAQHEMAKAEAAVDVDAVYRELDSRDDFDAAFEAIKARFSLKSMLIAMTALAVVLGTVGSGLFNGATFAGFICVSLLGLGTAHAWLNFRERKRREEVLARRDRQVRRARHLANHPDVPYEEEEVASPDEGNPFLEFAGSLTKLPRFGLGELMLSMTLAAFILVLLQVAGSPFRAAAALGIMAITGFALQAADYDVPRPVVLAWWLALFGFCLLTFVSTVLSAAGIGFFAV